MKSISLINVSFAHHGCDDLLHNCTATVRTDQIIAMIGDNGAGKSTCLKIIAGTLAPTAGRVVHNARVSMLDQIQPHDTQSGGQRQADYLARVFDSGADILLLDEPTNNLDATARTQFFGRLARFNGGAIIVSHDRELLRRADVIWELAAGKLTVYGGGYDFYVATRDALRANLESQYIDTQKRIAELNRTMMTAQNTRQHREAKQKKEIASAKRPRIAARALRGKSSETEAKKRRLILAKMAAQQSMQQTLTTQLRDDVIKIPMPSQPCRAKELIRIENMTFGYENSPLFHNFCFSMMGQKRVHLTGPNGAGKSTLIKLICGHIQPQSGSVRIFGRTACLNQDLNLLDPRLGVVDNISEIANILPHDAHAIAANFGFRGDAGHKPVAVLSGGELLKATLAAILGSKNQPDLLILDEPTNNLDIKSSEILMDALRQYHGAVLVVSHDTEFIRNIQIQETVTL